MKESLKICKTFVCNCGREYSFEISTDLAVENMIIEVSCPACGEKRSITAGSLLANKVSPQGEVFSSSSSSSSDSSPLSFMDSMETSAGNNYESSSSEMNTSEDSDHPDTSGSTDTLTEIEDDMATYKDMFGEA